MRKGYVYAPSVKRYAVSNFGGINMRPGAGEHEWSDLFNLVPDNGCLRTRDPRGLVVNKLSDGAGEYLYRFMMLPSLIDDMVVLHDGYALITKEGELIVNGEVLRGKSPKINEDLKRYLVPFGRSFVVLPDGVLISPKTDGTWEQKLIKNTYTGTSADVVMCKEDGTAIEAQMSDTEPVDAANGTAWIDTSGDAPVLCFRSAAQQRWVHASSMYMKIKAAGLADGFSVGDVVTISGMSYEDVNGSFEIIGLEEGLEEDSMIVVCVTPLVQFEQTAAFTIERDFPLMDFCIEHNNRLWSCRKGMNHKGEYVNEIYASKLGDPLNWFCYQGISTDSYAASVSSPGPFTGIGKTSDAVVFFKSDSVTMVYGSSPSDFVVQTFSCEGVQPGSAKSVVNINGSIYYKSTSGVYVFSGYQPYCCSSALNGKYSEAAAAAAGDKYYIRMKDETGTVQLFSYDAVKGVWAREDCPLNCELLTVNSALYLISQEFIDFPSFEHFPGLGSLDLDFYAVQFYVFDEKATDKVELQFLSPTGIIEIPAGAVYSDYLYEEEKQVSFSAETSDIGLVSPDHGRLQMLQLRVKMERGSILKVSAQYDGGEWIQVHETIAGKTNDSLCLPIPCRRCDRMRLRFEGVGNVVLYSVTRTVETASEVSVKW